MTTAEYAAYVLSREASGRIHELLVPVVMVDHSGIFYIPGSVARC